MEERLGFDPLLDELPFGIDAAEKARGPAGVAARPHWIHQKQQRVAVAIGVDFTNVEPMTARFALLPQTPARTAEEGRTPGSQSALECLPVHPGDHSHLPGQPVLHNRHDQPLFVELHATFPVIEGV